MDNHTNLFRLSIALNELYKHGKATVLKGQPLELVESVLSSMEIKYAINPDNDTYSELELLNEEHY